MRTATLYNFLLEANIIAGIAILLMLLIRRLLRRQLGNRAIYFAWLLVAIRLLCPLALPNPAINDIRPTASQDAAIRPIAGQIQIRFSDASRDLTDWVGDLRGGTRSTDPVVQDLNDFVNSTYNGTLSYRLMILYLIGAGLVLLYFLLANIRFRQKLRADRIEPVSGKLLEEYQALCRQRRVKQLPVYYVDPLPSACLVGVVRPYIALPLTATPREAVQLLTHELCHYKGRDHVWGVLRLACCVIHWFNPLVWLAASLSRTDGELACDDRVVEKLDNAQKLAYTNTLVLAAARRNAPGMAVLATGMTMTGKKLKNRVNAILRSGHAKKWLSVAFVTLACLALVAAFATAEYRVRPVMPDTTQSVFAAQSLSGGEDALAYGKAFLQSDFLGLSLSDAEWSVSVENGTYVVQAIASGASAPVEVSLLPNGVVVGYNDHDGWTSAYATTGLYDGDDDAQEDVAQYVVSFMDTMLPGVSNTVEALDYTGEGKYGDGWYVGFVGINEYSSTAYQFQVQVLPEVRMAYYRAADVMRSRFADEGDQSADPLAGSGMNVEVNGFSARDYADEDDTYTAPSADDMSLETALGVTLQAIYDKYVESAETMGRFQLAYGFREEDDPVFQTPYWKFGFTTGDTSDQYEVILSSPGGEILYIVGPGEGNG